MTYRNKQVIQREGGTVYIYMYIIVYNCSLNFLCAEKQADIDNDRKMQSFCISPLLLGGHDVLGGERFQ